MTAISDSSSLAQLHRALGIPENYAAERGLHRHEEIAESELTVISRTDERVIQLSVAAAANWAEMRRSAERDGVVLLPLSGYRSIARQAEIIRAQLRSGRPITDLLGAVAAPGFSEHHTGRAIDVGTTENKTIDERFSTTPAFRWLTKNAGSQGFVMSYPKGDPRGFVFEPWHWCWHEPLEK